MHKEKVVTAKDLGSIRGVNPTIKTGKPVVATEHEMQEAKDIAKHVTHKEKEQAKNPAPITKPLAPGEKPPLIDLETGEEVSEERVKEMVAWVGEWKKLKENKTKTATEAWIAVCLHFNVECPPPPMPREIKRPKKSNYTAPKKKRKKRTRK